MTPVYDLVQNVSLRHTLILEERVDIQINKESKGGRDTVKGRVQNIFVKYIGPSANTLRYLDLCVVCL